MFGCESVNQVIALCHAGHITDAPGISRRLRFAAPTKGSCTAHGNVSVLVLLLAIKETLWTLVIATVYPEVYPSDMPPILGRLEPSHEYIRSH